MHTKLNTLYLQFPDVLMKFSTNNERYYHYLKLYFNKIIVNKDVDRYINVEATALWQKKISLQVAIHQGESDNFRMIGGNTCVLNNRLITMRKVERKIKVCFDIMADDNKFISRGALRAKWMKDFLRYRVGQKREESVFFMLTYPLLYYPLFWYYERYKATHILHASALRYKNRGIVICGLEGMGKTSLSLSLLNDDGGSFISDNLIFYNSDNVYPCYELVRLYNDYNTSLLRGRFEKVTAFKSSKDFYAPLMDVRGRGISPHVVVFPVYSACFFVKELSIDEAVKKALILSFLPAELGNYVEYRHMYNLLDTSFDPWNAQCTILQKLFKEARCLMVGMRKEDGLDKNVERFKKVVVSE
ncbi:MAG: hypothetical protein KKH94_06355 [Candidatus Omnitrophica bacterium]|nr:hypothetical protein [Candidatus Omnitrophota bacterium]